MFNTELSKFKLLFLRNIVKFIFRMSFSINYIKLLY